MWCGCVCVHVCVCRKHQCWLHIRIHLQRLPNQAAMPLNMAPTTESFSRLENAELWELQSMEVESRLLSLHCSAPTDGFHSIPKSQNWKAHRNGKVLPCIMSLAAHNNNTINNNKINQLEKKQVEPKILFSLAAKGFGEGYTIRRWEEAVWGGAQCTSMCVWYV